MTVTLELQPETEKRLRELAARKGLDLAEYIREVLEKDASGGREAQAAAPREGKTFAQIFAPLERAVEASGLTDDELDALFRQAREEAWQARQARQGEP